MNNLHIGQFNNQEVEAIETAYLTIVHERIGKQLDNVAYDFGD